MQSFYSPEATVEQMHCYELVDRLGEEVQNGEVGPCPVMPEYVLTALGKLLRQVPLATEDNSILKGMGIFWRIQSGSTISATGYADDVGFTDGRSTVHKRWCWGRSWYVKEEVSSSFKERLGTIGNGMTGGTIVGRGDVGDGRSFKGGNIDGRCPTPSRNACALSSK